MRQRYIILQYVLWNRKNFHWLQRNKRSIQTLWLIILRCDVSGIEYKENFKESSLAEEIVGIINEFIFHGMKTEVGILFYVI